jgi:uncharacterized protein involved in response to NO
MMFFGGAAQLVLAVGFWLAELTGRYTGLWGPFDTTIPSTWAHALLMLFSLFPFFMFGFLMTTYPRWMNGTPVPRVRYAAAFWLLTAGAVLLYVGLVTFKGVLVAGLALLLAGWGVGLHALFAVYREAPTRDKSYETALNVALALGWLALLCYPLWMLTGEVWWLRLSLHGGLWLFLVPVLFAVSHRMIPYFGSVVLQDYRVVQPHWSLPLMWTCVAGHALLEAVGRFQWLFMFDLPLMVMAFHHSWHWGLRESFRVRLLAVLHIAFLWLGIGMALYSVQSLTLLLSGTFILGRAPLHALAIGFIAGMTVAMASRVTLGHSGRPLVLDDVTWACFLGLNATALLRIAAESPWLSALPGVNLNLAAAIAWLACLTPWVLRYAPMYLRPRVDRKPG